MQDSAYLLQVPSIAPEHTPLSRMPSILLTYDRFQDPRPFRFDWVVDTGSVQDNVIQLLASSWMTLSWTLPVSTTQSKRNGRGS